MTQIKSVDPVSDGCARIHNEFITKQKTKFSYDDVKDCYKHFPFDKDTIDTLTGLIGGFYVFLDKAKEPPQLGFNFRPIDVEHLFYDLKDQHTQFGSYCFLTFFFYTNMTFYSVVHNGEQKIKVFDDTIDRSNINCEVTHIDGQQALKVISEFAKDSVFASRDLGVRFNIALDLIARFPSFALRSEIPKNSKITYTLKCDNKNEFDVKRSWNAFSNPTLLNKFNDSKSYFDNICNPTKGNELPIPFRSMLREVAKEFNDFNRILNPQDQSVIIIKNIDNFVSFFKINDFGVVKIFTEDPAKEFETIAILPDVIQGFKELANTGVKKVVLDLSDNVGGYRSIASFFNLLLFPNTYPSFDHDIRLSEQMRLAIAEQYRLATLDNIFRTNGYVNAKNHANFTSVDDFFGNNVYKRGGIKENYSNRFINDTLFNEMSQIIQKILVNPLPWKPDDYIILTDGLCGSSCALITEHAAEVNDVSTVAIGGLASNSLLSYSTYTGGMVANSTQTFNSFGKLGLLNNTLMPKLFPLTGMAVSFTMDEVYSKIDPDEILEFAFRPADFRLFYDEKNIRNISILWSQAAALIGLK
ncbi:2401_t:CDS:2, partial [Cetraspora pellucida]